MIPEMNPITNIRNQNKINQRELDLGVAGGSNKSWHQKYSDSAWIYVGGLPYDLNEGDIITVFSQYGEIVNINLIRDHKTGKSRGFAFVCYQDQRSTILAVDNFNGITLLKRIIRVDHVEEYKVPKYREGVSEDIRHIWEEGCAPKPINVAHEDEEEDKDEDPTERLKRIGKLNEDGLIELDENLKKEMKKQEKRAKKEAKRKKKEEKRAKKIRKRAAEEGIDADEASKLIKMESDSWKDQKRLIDSGPLNPEDLYESNEHFKFGKAHKEIPPPPIHNPRPDFEKADWRDIEMYKALKEKERLEKGETQTNWKEEEHYLPTRFHRE